MGVAKGWKFVISITVPFLASVIGSVFTASSVSTWYGELIQPSFTPPDWIFAPVWTILYALMGISLYLVWTTKADKKAFTFFGIQLFLNILWSILFFGLRNPFFAFIEIVVLWTFILLTIIYFHRINKTASYLLLPYIVWVTFAAVLNFAIVLLN